MLIMTNVIFYPCLMTENHLSIYLLFYDVFCFVGLEALGRVMGRFVGIGVGGSMCGSCRGLLGFGGGVL